MEREEWCTRKENNGTVLELNPRPPAHGSIPVAVRSPNPFQVNQDIFSLPRAATNQWSFWKFGSVPPGLSRRIVIQHQSYLDLVGRELNSISGGIYIPEQLVPSIHSWHVHYRQVLLIMPAQWERLPAPVQHRMDWKSLLDGWIGNHSTVLYIFLEIIVGFP